MGAHEPVEIRQLASPNVMEKEDCCQSSPGTTMTQELVKAKAGRVILQ